MIYTLPDNSVINLDKLEYVSPITNAGFRYSINGYIWGYIYKDDHNIRIGNASKEILLNFTRDALIEAWKGEGV